MLGPRRLDHFRPDGDTAQTQRPALSWPCVHRYLSLAGASDADKTVRIIHILPLARKIPPLPSVKTHESCARCWSRPVKEAQQPAHDMRSRGRLVVRQAVDASCRRRSLRVRRHRKPGKWSTHQRAADRVTGDLRYRVPDSGRQGYWMLGREALVSGDPKDSQSLLCL